MIARANPVRPSPALLALLTGLVALGPLSTDLYLPSLPMLGNDLHATPAEAQLTLSVFLAGLAAAILFYGPLADRYGRRPVLLAGLGLYVLASAATIEATNINWLIGLRFLQAVGSCSAAVTCRAVVRDVYGTQGVARAMSYLSAAIALAPAIGPIIGGVVAEIAGWRGNFALLFAYGSIATVLAWRYLPETNPNAGLPRPGLSSMVLAYRQMAGNSLYRGYVFCAAFGYSGIVCFLSASSFVLIEVMKVPPRWFGACFAIFIVGYMTGALLSARLNARFGVMKLLAMGNIQSLLGVAVLIFWLWKAPSLTGILIPLYFYMVGVGATMPNATASAIDLFPQSAGTASALLGFIQRGVAAIFGAALGYLAALDAMPMALGIMIATLGSALSYLQILKAKRSKVNR